MKIEIKRYKNNHDSKDFEGMKEGKKKCYKCNAVKNFDGFHKNKSKPFGLAIQCKECKMLQDKEYHIKNKEFRLKANKTWRNKNKAHIKRKNKNYRDNNKEAAAIHGKIYYEENREKIKKRTILWNKDNKEKKKQYSKTYFKRNRNLLIAKNYMRKGKINIAHVPLNLLKLKEIHLSLKRALKSSQAT